MTSNALLGPALSPPPGGLDGLRRLIRRRQRRAAGLTLTIAMLMAVPMLLVPPDPLSPPEIAVDGGAALEWPSSEPDVRIFLVARVTSSATNRRAADAEPE
jgi:hypothetical protein